MGFKHWELGFEKYMLGNGIGFPFPTLCSVDVYINSTEATFNFAFFQTPVKI